VSATRAAVGTGARPPGHPGPTRVALPAAIRDALVAHARAELPNEMCGMVAGTATPAAGGRPTTWHPTRNVAASPFRYEVHPDDLLRVSLDIDDRAEEVWAIAHSHVGSPARPSPIDVERAFYPDALFLLVSLDEAEADPATGAPSVRAWRIVDGQVFEVGLEIAG